MTVTLLTVTMTVLRKALSTVVLRTATVHVTIFTVSAGLLTKDAAAQDYLERQGTAVTQTALSVTARIRLSRC